MSSKKFNLCGTLTLSQIKGRIPTAKPGSAIRAKKGKGSYKRNAKHQEGWSKNDHPFFIV